MATRTITENVNQAVQDFDNIKQARIDKGIEIPNGTPTSEYADKIGTIKINGLDINNAKYAYKIRVLKKVLILPLDSPKTNANL